MITIIDYGMGNLQSVYNAFKDLGFATKVSDDPKEIKSADKVVLPGVGAFRDCLNGVVDGGFRDEIFEFIDRKRPFLGICVGMQLLFEKSFEFGEHEGFGFFNGFVQKFPQKVIDEGGKIPHMGWNSIKILKEHPILKGLTDNLFLYFVHSFYAPVTEHTILECNYGVDFSAAVAKDNIVGVQFHPEKSQTLGLKILKNFGEM